MAESFSPIWTDKAGDSFRQDESDRVFQEITTLPQVIGSAILTDAALLSANVNLVEHTLGRPFRGWHIVRQNTATFVVEDPDNTEDTALFLPLIVGTNATVDILVF